MTLTDPRLDLAEQSSFVGYLVGLAGLAQLIRAVATPDVGRRADVPQDADDFVHVLLGVASLGRAIERLAESDGEQQVLVTALPRAIPTSTRWLR